MSPETLTVKVATQGRTIAESATFYYSELEAVDSWSRWKGTLEGVSAAIGTLLLIESTYGRKGMARVDGSTISSHGKAALKLIGTGPFM